MHRWSKQKIGKETLDLNYTLNEMKLTDINSTFYPTAAKPHSFQVHREFSRTDHMLSHKTHLNTFKKFEIMSDVFSNLT